MGRTLRRVLGGMALLLAAFVVTTWWALESGGVAIVETRTPDGVPRATHVWYVEPDGELWVEAGTPQNGWYLDIRQRPELRFESEGRGLRCTAQPLEGASARDRIRTLLRQKYGFRDAWVGMLVDTSASVAVRLDACAPGAG